VPAKRHTNTTFIMVLVFMLGRVVQENEDFKAWKRPILNAIREEIDVSR
jgi:hypothetical protein